MFLGERLKDLRINKKLSQDKLGSLLEVSKVAISNWETGKSVPSEANLERIAKVFDVDAHYFYSYGELLTIFNKLNTALQGRLIEYAATMLKQQELNNPSSATKYPYKTYNMDSFLETLNDSSKIPNFTLSYDYTKTLYQFALWMQDDSLEPEIPMGEVVLLKFANEVEDGNLYLVVFNGQPMFRRVYKHSTYYKLVPINNKYDAIFAPFEEKPEIIGEIVRHFKPIEN
ncbi:S24 family peptidase [Streptococcus suis]|uniref:S24 family peptidase n=1 Tax=Streptococcus suis TaxID=1307 RepID=UPI0005CD388B|nr:S24 family peptidase [Streptococcus suis]NQI05876.1 helix-turn-helix domain-containing protein [Streptococcus suis]CYU09508.1 LexA repressor [Streptococcus suis]HEM2740577.1 helix-turn-helix domain-containing protein [Streptococcus suis]